MKRLALVFLLVLAGCATPPAPRDARDPDVYRRSAPVSYPMPR